MGVEHAALGRCYVGDDEGFWAVSVSAAGERCAVVSQEVYAQIEGFT